MEKFGLEQALAFGNPQQVRAPIVVSRGDPDPWIKGFRIKER